MSFITERDAALHRPFYMIIGPTTGPINKFGMDNVQFQLRWLEMHKSPNIEQTVTTAFTEVLNKLYDEGKPGDMVGCIIDHPLMNNPINIPFSAIQKLTPEKLREAIRRVQQSKRTIKFDGDLYMKFTRVRAPKGGRLGQR